MLRNSFGNISVFSGNLVTPSIPVSPDERRPHSWRNYDSQALRGSELAADLTGLTDLASDRPVWGNFRALAQTQRETTPAAKQSVVMTRIVQMKMANP
jgi:hypothetical protein